jgi:hypothetical protein
MYSLSVFCILFTTQRAICDFVSQGTMQLPEFLRTFGMDDVDPEYNPLFKGVSSLVLSCRHTGLDS